MDYRTYRGDLDCLTEEERYELELSFSESDEWYDEYPFENRSEEIAWSEYMIEQAKFTYEAVSFYKKYLEYRGEKKPSLELLSIFKYNRCHIRGFYGDNLSRKVCLGSVFYLCLGNFLHFTIDAL